MELWIRSQDKETLVKVDDISIEMNMIYGYFDKSTEYEHLGNYATKERAIEVLDEIQNIIKKKDIITNCKGLLSLVNNKSLDEANKILERIEEIAVYEMPKE